MKPSIFFILFILVFAGILAFNVFFSKKALIIRKLKKANYKKLSKIKENDIVKIVGQVVLIEEALIAPLSKRKCAHYYVYVEQKSSSKNSNWETVIEEEVTSKFLIREEESFAFINDKNTKSYIVQDKNYSSGFMNDATLNLKSYLSKKSFESEGFFGINKKLRYNEGILEEGEEVAVFGKGNWKESSILKLPKKYGKVLEITSQEDVAIYLSDDPETTLKTAKKESKAKRYKKDNKRRGRYLK